MDFYQTFIEFAQSIINEFNIENADSYLNMFVNAVSHAGFREAWLQFCTFLTNHIPSPVLRGIYRVGVKMINDGFHSSDNNEYDKRAIKKPRDDYVKPVIPTITQSDDLTDKFEKYDPTNHIAMIGDTNTGKTTWLCTQIAKDKFDFEQVWCLLQANTKDKDGARIKNLVGAYFVDKNNYPPPANAVQFAYWSHPGDPEHIHNLVSTRQEKKTLFICDDIQTNGSNGSNLVSEWINLAKNSNVTMVVTLHGQTSQSSNKTLTIKNACNYLTFFNPSAQTIKTGLNVDIKTAKNIVSKLEPITIRHHKVLLYDKSKKEIYYGYGNMYNINPRMKEK